jgi:F0F1-type ATP synthase membrane subunit b/b'
VTTPGLRELRVKYPAMVAAVDERDQRIAERLKAGELLVKQLDTVTEHAVTSAPPADQPH